MESKKTRKLYEAERTGRDFGLQVDFQAFPSRSSNECKHSGIDALVFTKSKREDIYIYTAAKRVIMRDE